MPYRNPEQRLIDIPIDPRENDDLGTHVLQCGSRYKILYETIEGLQATLRTRFRRTDMILWLILTAILLNAGISNPQLAAAVMKLLVKLVAL